MTTIAVHGPSEPVALGDAGPRTAADLDADAGRIAAALAAHPAGEVVLICSDRYRFAAALLGAWAAGHAVRLPPNGQPEALRAASSGPAFRALLHDMEGVEGLFIPALLEAPAPAKELELELALDRSAVTFTTSGSTGAHQSWPKRGAQMVDEGALIGTLFGVTPGSRVLCTVPPHHIYGFLWSVLMPLRSGAAMIREGPLHAEPVLATIERYGVTHLVSVPAHLAALAAADRAPPGVVVFSAGAPIPLATTRALRERHGWRVVEVYGSTETGGIGWRDPEQDLWTVFPDATVTADEDGALLVDSPRLDAGTPRPFRLADRIEIHPDRRFALLGRMDDVVKVAGKRVSLREVEQRLLAVPGVRDAAALAQPSPGLRGEEIWVAVAASDVTPERLREALAAWLEPVALPRRIRVLEALPREATGKIVREKLRALFDRASPRRTRIDPEAEEVVTSPPGKEARKLTFTVAPDLRWFEGHFPGYPVLPGVAQLDGLVLAQVERLWPDAGPLRTLKRLKFTKVIRPGQRIEMTLERDAAQGTVAFVIEGPEGRCASGSLVLERESR